MLASSLKITVHFELLLHKEEFWLHLRPCYAPFPFITQTQIANFKCAREH